jgi:cyclic pyranopterin phosphate synthase
MEFSRQAAMLDPFGRAITYLRVSVTDRCDLRCVYCMAEDTAFLPKSEILSLEEIDRIAAAFVRLGTRKIRVTGGEPLVRRNVITLFRMLGARLGQGLDELTLTTNGTLLARHAAALVDAGVRRVNVSLDTLIPERFAAMTRWGRIDNTLAGIAAAQEAGLQVKINTVAVPGVNDDEFDSLLEWCGARGFDLTLIETMPMGDIGDGVAGRDKQYLPLSIVRAQLRRRWTLTESDHVTGGPARYFDVAETGRQIGFITPMSHNFCESCNRVRLACDGTLYMCLGQEDAADLRSVVRLHPDEATLDDAIRDAIARKPKGHDFVVDRGKKSISVARTMSATGG